MESQELGFHKICQRLQYVADKNKKNPTTMVMETQWKQIKGTYLYQQLFTKKNVKQNIIIRRRCQRKLVSKDTNLNVQRHIMTVIEDDDYKYRISYI